MYRCLLLLSLWPVLVLADTAAPDEPVASTEDQLHMLDTNHDGQVSMSEIRAYLEARNGKGYEQTLLTDMETKANTSCGTPFSRSFY